HLGYLEFGELARGAQRTLDQRQIVINNLAIRRAIEELKVARDYEQVCRILLAAFGSNDFDGFERKASLFPGERIPMSASDNPQMRRAQLAFRWNKNEGLNASDDSNMWTLALQLVSTSNRRRGLLLVQRGYSPRDLQLDINLLTSVFPRALADALDRTLGSSLQIIPLPLPLPE